MDIKVKSHLKPCAAVSIAIMIVALVMTAAGGKTAVGVDAAGVVLSSIQISLWIFTILSAVGIFFSLKRGRVL